MPKVDNVGFGKFTTLKMEVLGKIFAMHLAISQAVLNNRKSFREVYRYIDATSGKGFVSESDIPGSPLVFLGSVNSNKIYIPYSAHFIEQEEVNFHQLKENVRHQARLKNWDIRDRVQFHVGGYEKIIPSLLGTVDNRELGLVFIDHSGEMPDFDAISYVARIRPRMEILIYLSATNIKRLHHVSNKSLLDYMQQISKQNWLIRRPAKWDEHEWTFLLGSNTDIFKDYKAIDFYSLDSSEAQSFFPKLNLTSKQRMEKIQPKLPGIDN